MLTKEQVQTTINLWKPSLKRIKSLISLFDKTIEKDKIIYCYVSPDSALSHLHEAKEILEDLIESLEDECDE
jgi:predicted RNA-binding protein with EMAP domain